MKKCILPVAAILLFCTLSFSSCTDEISCKNDTGTIPLTEFSLTGTSYNWEYTYWDYVFFINNNIELPWSLEKRYPAEEIEYPEVDFSKHSVVFVSGVSTNPVSEISKKLFQQSTHKYVLDIEIKTLEKETDIQPWCIGLVTNKISSISKIELNVVTTHDEKIIEIPFTEYSLPAGKDDPKTGGDMEECGCYWKNESTQNFPYWQKLYHINSNQELEEHIACNDGFYPVIDFSKHTLLLTKGYLTSGGNDVLNAVFFKNGLGKYILNLTVYEHFRQPAYIFMHAILIPKLPAKETVRLDVTRLDCYYSVLYPCLY